MLAQLPQPGTLFAGRYEIRTLLDVGGFARVYLARDRDADRDVALKIISPARLVGSGLNAAEKRFYREARLISRLKSPSTVRLFEYGRTPDGLLFLAFEFIRGRTLQRALAETGPMPEAQVRDVMAQVLASLHEAHALQILHRDIKPMNIMLCAPGVSEQVKVIDFGIAKSVASDALEESQLTLEGMIVGTPAYMSPEQLLGGSLGPQSDLYSVGLIGYEMLVGRPLFPEGADISKRVANPEAQRLPKMLGVSEELREIVNRLLRDDPEERFATARETLQALGASVEAVAEQTVRIVDRTRPASTISFPILSTVFGDLAATTVSMANRPMVHDVDQTADDEMVTTKPLPGPPDTVDGATSWTPVSGDVVDGRYRLDAVIGRGGMGVVHRARQLSIDRDVAVKLLPPEAAHIPALVARFERELDLARTLNHPNVVQLYDGGEADGVLFMVMELLEGQDLKQFLAERGALPIGEAIDLLIPVAEAIADAHDREIVHRDLKPSNIFVCEDRATARIKVLDFGVAKSLTTREHDLTKSGQLSGTPSYMAPEVVLKRKGRKPCDVYSLGLIFVEMLAGEGVFTEGTMQETLFRRLRKPIPVPPLYVGTAVETFVRASTERRPEARLPDGRAFLDELLRVRERVSPEWFADSEADHGRAAVPSEETATRTAPQRQTPPKAVVIGIIIVTAVVIVALVAAIVSVIFS